MRHGFLLINKPRGPTSHDVVQSVRLSLGEPRIGHLGTLDPLAQGLLVLAIGGKGLKCVELFSDLEKEYVAEVTLGSRSSTYDGEGVIEKVERKPGVEPPEDLAALQTKINERFVGRIEQVPPMASAIHIGGERSYRKMRAGKIVDLPSRKVQITKCQIVAYAYPILNLRVACGSGTYIRSLANDIGGMLRLGGYLSALERTEVGHWKVNDALKPEEAKWAHVLPLKNILASFPRLDLTDEQWTDIQFGRSIESNPETGPLIGWHDDLPVALLEKDKKREGMIKPRKVL